MTRLPVSVCIISGAEAHRIRRTLESVADWTSEIVVVLNQEVADGTAELAESAGAKVYRESWKGHVAQKNSAAQKATQDWVLGLDADEVVSPELKEELERLLSNPAAAELRAGYRFPRRTLYLGRWIRHGDWYPDLQLRLWRRGRGRWGGVDPHDRLEVDGAIGRLRGDLLHYSMENLDHQIRKMMRYADDFARVCAEQGRPVGVIDLLTRPPWRFVRSYILKGGFLDGWQGLCIAWTTAFYTFLRYARARERQTSASQ
jgi:glycosyltransferase involved in cell wall biosynthesis